MGSATDELRPVGVVEHYFPRPHVAAIFLQKGDLEWGDRILIRGHGTDLSEPVESMEIDHRHVMEAHAGDRVGVRINYPVKAGDAVYVMPRRPYGRAPEQHVTEFYDEDPQAQRRVRE